MDATPLLRSIELGLRDGVVLDATQTLLGLTLPVVERGLEGTLLRQSSEETSRYMCELIDIVACRAAHFETSDDVLGSIRDVINPVVVKGMIARDTSISIPQIAVHKVPNTDSPTKSADYLGITETSSVSIKNSTRKGSSLKNPLLLDGSLQSAQQADGKQPKRSQVEILAEQFGIKGPIKGAAQELLPMRPESQNTIATLQKVSSNHVIRTVRTQQQQQQQNQNQKDNNNNNNNNNNNVDTGPRVAFVKGTKQRLPQKVVLPSLLPEETMESADTSVASSIGPSGQMGRHNKPRVSKKVNEDKNNDFNLVSNKTSHYKPHELPAFNAKTDFPVLAQGVTMRINGQLQNASTPSILLPSQQPPRSKNPDIDLRKQQNNAMVQKPELSISKDAYMKTKGGQGIAYVPGKRSTGPIDNAVKKMRIGQFMNREKDNGRPQEKHNRSPLFASDERNTMIQVEDAMLL